MFVITPTLTSSKWFLKQNATSYKWNPLNSSSKLCLIFDLLNAINKPSTIIDCLIDLLKSSEYFDVHFLP